MKTIALLLLSACIASAVPGDAAWKAENKRAWDQIKVEFAPSWGLAECLRIAREWDRVALAKKWPLYYDPWKPLIYLRCENAQRIEDEKKATAARYAKQTFLAQVEARESRKVYPSVQPPQKDPNDEVLRKLEEIRRVQEAESLQRFIERNN
jgi:hypothetical protein